MCDGLSEFSMQDGKVTAVPITTLDLGIELLSQVMIIAFLIIEHSTQV